MKKNIMSGKKFINELRTITDLFHSDWGAMDNETRLRVLSDIKRRLDQVSEALQASYTTWNDTTLCMVLTEWDTLRRYLNKFLD